MRGVCVYFLGTENISEVPVPPNIYLFTSTVLVQYSLQVDEFTTRTLYCVMLQY